MRPIAVCVLHALALTAGLAVAFHPTLTSRFALLQTDPGDTLLNHYILEHTWHWVTGQPGSESLWSPPCFCPQPLTLAYSENLLGTAPVYWLFRCGCGELLSYQLWMMGVGALTYATTAWTLRRFGVGHLLAALGAVGYAFGLPRVVQLGHQQLMPALFSPPAVYAAWRFLDRPSLGWLSSLVSLILLQTLASVYLGWFLALGLAVFAAVRLTGDATSRRGVIEFIVTRRRALAALAVALAVALVVMFAPYVWANRGFRRSYSGEASTMVPRPASWFSPPPGSAWANYLPPTTGPLAHEHHLFPGAVLILLAAAGAVVALVRPEQVPPVARAALVAGAVLVGLSLMLGRWSAWSVVYWAVPGATAIRAVSRIFTAVYLFWWVGALIATETWLAKSGGWRHAVAAVLLLVGVAEQTQPRLPAFDPRPFYAEVDRLAGELRGARAGYVEPDPQAYFWVSHLAAQWAGLKAGIPVVNGYSGRWPFHYPDPRMCYGPTELAAWLGASVKDVRVLPAARLAAAYPAPDLPPEQRAMDFRPYHPEQRAERLAPWTSPTRPSAPQGNDPPAP